VVSIEDTQKDREQLADDSRQLKTLTADNMKNLFWTACCLMLAAR
jgi:hypothetical protein